jgi:hypothetical protein
MMMAQNKKDQLSYGADQNPKVYCKAGKETAGKTASTCKALECRWLCKQLSGYVKQTCVAQAIAHQKRMHP